MVNNLDTPEVGRVEILLTVEVWLHKHSRILCSVFVMEFMNISSKSYKYLMLEDIKKENYSQIIYPNKINKPINTTVLSEYSPMLFPTILLLFNVLTHKIYVP